MSQSYQKQIQIRFREADPAGILFFGQVFSLAHDCFEDFIQAAGVPWKDWFWQREYMIPIRHTESNFHRPFLPGETYTVHASVARLGDSSFQMRYRFQKGEDLHAEVLMVHAFLEGSSKKKVSVPEKFRTHLKPYLETP